MSTFDHAVVDNLIGRVALEVHLFPQAVCSLQGVVVEGGRALREGIEEPDIRRVHGLVGSLFHLDERKNQIVFWNDVDDVGGGGGGEGLLDIPTSKQKKDKTEPSFGKKSTTYVTE